MCVETARELRLFGATVHLMTAVGEAVAAVSGEPVRRVAQRQFDLAEGPAREAFTSGGLVVVHDLTVDQGRWPAWAPVAVTAGVSGAYALPLGIGAERLGAFTSYTQYGMRVARPALQRLLRSADEITELLLSLRGDGRGLLSDAEGQRDMHIRAEVYQAQGMLMVALDISLSDALARLRAIAYAEDIDLNQLAVDLVAGRRPMPGS